MELLNHVVRHGSVEVALSKPVANANTQTFITSRPKEGTAEACPTYYSAITFIVST